MNASQDCYARLGLRAGAEPREIRRAYARELKQIDQEQDAAGFQALREAYELALHLAQQNVAAAPAPMADPMPLPASAASAPPLQPSEPASPASAEPQPAAPAPWSAASQEALPADPGQLAKQVFEVFAAAAAQLVAAREGRHESAWIALLEEHLDDERLLNLTARTFFEAHIAMALTRGWQPGNHMLFVAASILFDWSHDRRRLAQFGQAGHMIDQAIDERHMFNLLPENEKYSQRKLASRLRDPRRPGPEELHRAKARIALMLARFPAMTALTVDGEILEKWRLAIQARLATSTGPSGAGGHNASATTPTPAPVPTPPPARATSRINWLKLTPFIIVLCIFLSQSGIFTKPPPKGFYPPSTATPAANAAPPAADTALPAVSTVLTAAQEDEIQSRIRYFKWSEGRVAVFRVALNPDRSFNSMQRTLGAHDAELEQAVRSALRQTRFSLQTPLVFNFNYIAGAPHKKSAARGWEPMPAGGPLVAPPEAWKPLPATRLPTR